MLIYHPAYDVNHCEYRLLQIILSSTHQELPWDLVRLLDFYSLFPHLLKEIHPLPRELSTYRRILETIPSAYEAIPNAKRILFDLEAIQSAAVANLLAKDLLDVAKFREGLVVRSNQDVPKEILSSIDSDRRASAAWFLFLVDELPLVDFFGKSGLKARSGLMEFRYDV